MTTSYSKSTQNDKPAILKKSTLGTENLRFWMRRWYRRKANENGEKNLSFQKNPDKSQCLYKHFSTVRNLFWWPKKKVRYSTPTVI